MLTATYSIVVLNAEQDKTRHILARLQHYIETTWKGLHNLDLAFLSAAFDKLVQFDKYCRGRKLEIYLIPVLREMSREAAMLIAELEALNDNATMLLRSIGEQLKAMFDSDSGRRGDLCENLRHCCMHFSTKLDREERELLPMARRLLAVEDWFSIAAQFLADDSTTSGGRNPSRPALVKPAHNGLRAGH